MQKKLKVTASIMLVIIILIISGNQVIIRLFASFSQKLITEYHELHSIQELKVSLSKTITYLHIADDTGTTHFHPEFQEALQESAEKMEILKSVITDIHKGQPWTDTKLMFSALLKYGALWKEGMDSQEALAEQISYSINKIIQNIDSLVNETLKEIEEYEHRNNTVVKHGSMTILAFGIVLILFLTIGGLRFIKTLTKPIDQLVNGMVRIGKGETKYRVKVDSKDEFLFLADSINSMVENLYSTTISKEFFSDILNNLYGALLVTDTQGKITFINDSACRLLNCDESELMGQDSITVFNCKSTTSITGGEILDLEEYALQLRKMTEMRSTSGQLIPVYVTCTLLKDVNGEYTGMVVVGHDLTEEKAQEEKLERIRKDRLIAINEAEENERIRIAKDLHDGLGQILTGISYSVQSLKPTHTNDMDLIQKIETGITSAIQEAKNISHNLTPIILRDFGLIAALENLVDKINQLNKTKVRFSSYNYDIRIDKRLEKALYRISQEGLHNIIKHSKAESASIELFRENQQIVLVIEDNGQGFEVNETLSDIGYHGIGLVSMKERATVFDGVFTIDSKIGRGTEIIIEFPCPKTKVIDG